MAVAAVVVGVVVVEEASYRLLDCLVKPDVGGLLVLLLAPIFVLGCGVNAVAGMQGGRVVSWVEPSSCRLGSKPLVGSARDNGTNTWTSSIPILFSYIPWYTRFNVVKVYTMGMGYTIGRWAVSSFS